MRSPNGDHNDAIGQFESTLESMYFSAPLYTKTRIERTHYQPILQNPTTPNYPLRGKIFSSKNDSHVPKTPHGIPSHRRPNTKHPPPAEIPRAPPFHNPLRCSPNQSPCHIAQLPRQQHALRPQPLAHPPPRNPLLRCRRLHHRHRF